MFDRLFRKAGCGQPVINPARSDDREMLLRTAMASPRVRRLPRPGPVSKRLRLSDFGAMLRYAGMVLDTRMAGLFARAQQDSNRPYHTFALALALFEQPAWEVMSPERPLRYWRLIEINQPAARPLITSALKADERIVNYLKGLNYLDDRLAALMTPVAATSRSCLRRSGASPTASWSSCSVRSATRGRRSFSSSVAIRNRSWPSRARRAMR
jgi:hypothetical protein